MRACAALIAVIPQIVSAEIAFTPITVPNHVYDGGWEHFVGGGVAVFDCNDDALPDFFAAGGENPAQLFVNTSQSTLSFVTQTPKALSINGATGAYPIDIDNDGLMDLAILRVGADVLLKGRGDCTFEPFTDLTFESGEDTWTTAFSATWEQDNRLPTLAFGTYVDRNDPNGPFEVCDHTLLYRPSETGFATPTRLTPGYCALSMLFSDWNHDGNADLRISNDRHYYVREGREQLWKMDPQPRLYSAQDGWQDYQIWGMGIASRDITGDGFPEVYLTSMGDQKFQRFEGDSARPTWTDATYDYGTTAHRPHVGGDGRPSTGWHAQFGDVNNDGLDDLFVTKGNVDQMPVAAMDDPNSLLLQKPEGGFKEISHEVGLASPHRARGGALVDLNGDGLLDVIVLNRRAALEVYENTTKTDGNWLSVALKQTGANTAAIGAFIEVKAPVTTLVREVTIGGGHAGGQLGPEHFGLGNQDAVQVRVIWPDGQVTPWQEYAAKQSITISR